MIRCQQTLSKFSIESPIGEIIIEYCQVGIHGISQIDTIDDSNFKPIPKCDVKLLGKRDITNTNAKVCLDWLATYFHDAENVSNVPQPKACVILENGSFLEQAWFHLATRVSFGDTITYGGLASSMGKPGAARAVGTAMARNPLQIYVPCHRVVPSSGKNGNYKVGNYSRGRKNKVKQWLLQHEGFDIHGENIICKTNKYFLNRSRAFIFFGYSHYNIGEVTPKSNCTGAV